MPQFYFQCEVDQRSSGHDSEFLDSTEAAIALADQMAEGLGRNRSPSLNVGRYVIVTGADFEEIYRSPLLR